MSRSYAIMAPGGFYVGSTTGWLVNQTEPEYLRRVPPRQLLRSAWAALRRVWHVAQVSHQRHADCVLLPDSQVSML